MKNIYLSRFFSYIKNPSWLVTGSFTLGVLAKHYWDDTYPSPKKTVDNLDHLFKTDEEKMIPLLTDLPKTTRHSLACYFLHELTMFGGFIENDSKESKNGYTRSGIFATPYARSLAGVINFVVHENYVLMVRDRHKQKVGHNPILNFSQGYVSPGSKVPSITRRSDMDKVEEEILKNKGGLAPYRTLYSPENVVLTGVPYKEDKHPVGAAFRELQEETDENLSPDNIKTMRHFGYWQGLISSGDSMTTNYYLWVLHRKKDHLVASESGEVMSVHWIKFSEIQIEETSKQGFVMIDDQRYDISAKDVTVLLHGLKAYRYLYPQDSEINIPARFEAAMVKQNDQNIPGFTVLDQPYPSVEHYIRPNSP